MADVKIGAVAVEDEGIFFAIAAANEQGVTGWELGPQLWRWPGDVISGRYSRAVIEAIIRRGTVNLGSVYRPKALGLSDARRYA